MGDVVHADFGPEVEEEVTPTGGRQSKAIGAFYLIPAKAIRSLRGTFISTERTFSGHVEAAWEHLTGLLADDRGADHLGRAFAHLALALEVESNRGVPISRMTLGGAFPATALVRISQVMGPAADRYGRGNFRLIPYEDHVNHALQHLVALEVGDESDDHLGHAITRLALAIELEDPAFRFTATPETQSLLDAAEVVRRAVGDDVTVIVTRADLRDEKALAKVLVGLDDEEWGALVRAMCQAFQIRDGVEPQDDATVAVFTAGATITLESAREFDEVR